MIIEKITNDDVGEIEFTSLRYSATYAGAQCCSFDKEIADYLINHYMEQRQIGDNSKVHLLKTKQTEKLVYFSSREFLNNHIVLPFWSCSGRLTSKWANEDDEAEYFYSGSYLDVLWFQDEAPWPIENDTRISSIDIEFGSTAKIEVDSFIIEQIREIHWRELAVSYGYDL